MRKQKEEKTGDLQQFLGTLQEIRGPVMRLAAPGGRSRYRSVVEVTGTFLNLLDEAKQQDVQALYHRLFLGLDFPVQIIVQVRPLNIEAYLQFVDVPPSSSASPAAAWQVLAHDHAAFLRALTKRQPLLGRRFFLVIPAEEAFSTAGAGLPVVGSWGGQRKEVQEELSVEQAAGLLRTRYETISYHLQSIGVSSHLLTNKKLAAFYRSYAAPQPPLYLRVQRDYLQLGDDQYIRVEHVDHLPRLVGFAWLKPLIETDEVFDLIHHIAPRPAADSLMYLRRQQTHAQASLMLASDKGRNAPPDAALANNDLEPLIESVTAGEQVIVNSDLHIIIRGSSLEDLERRTRRVNQRISTVFTRKARTLSYEQAPAFQSCAPGAMIAGREPQLIPSMVGASMLPFFDHFVFKPSETAILEGMTPHNEPVILDWFSDLTNANRLIFGPSGWGKSYKAKLDILRLYYVYKHLEQKQEKQKSFQILIVDPERETTRSQHFNLIARLGGQSIRFSPGSSHRLNPLDLPPTVKTTLETDVKEDVLKNHIQRVHRILDAMLAHNVEDTQKSLEPGEKSLLDACLYETYRRAGIYAGRETHNRPAPLLRDLYQVLVEETCGPDETNLAQRLRRYVNGSLSGLFSERTNILLDNSVIQFDVKDLESELRPIGLLLINQFIWNTAFASPLPRFLFVDELATMARYRSGQVFLEEIFQRARKYGLAVVGMTQEPSSLSKSIIANSATHILLHQDESTIDIAADLFKLSDREAQRVRGFDRGEALMLLNGKRMIVRFGASPEEDKLVTTNRRQIEALEAAIAAAETAATGAQRSHAS